MMNFEELYDDLCVPKPVDPSKPTCKDELMNLLEMCFNEVPDLTEVIYVGYTPSFNDGDPCYHSREIAYKLSNKIYYDGMDGLVISNIEQLEEDGWSEDDKELLSVKVFRLLEANPFDEMVYTTNYKLTITRDSENKINIDYDYFYIRH